jgi:hypothetical protein
MEMDGMSLGKMTQEKEAGTNSHADRGEGPHIEKQLDRKSDAELNELAPKGGLGTQVEKEEEDDNKGVLGLSVTKALNPGKSMTKQGTAAHKQEQQSTISMFEPEDDEMNSRKEYLDDAVAHHISGFARKKSRQTRTKRVGAASGRPKHEPEARVCPCCTPEWLLSHEEIVNLARINGEEAALAEGGGGAGGGGQEEFDEGGDDGEEISMSERRRQGRTGGLVLYG